MAEYLERHTSEQQTAAIGNHAAHVESSMTLAGRARIRPSDPRCQRRRPKPPAARCARGRRTVVKAQGEAVVRGRPRMLWRREKARGCSR